MVITTVMITASAVSGSAYFKGVGIGAAMLWVAEVIAYFVTANRKNRGNG